MSKRYWALAAALAGAVMLSGCPFDSNNNSTPAASGPRLASIAAVPGVTSAVVYSFDLSATDQATGFYYVTDRTTKSIDVVNSATNTVVSQFTPGFVGCRNAAGAAVAGCLAGTSNDTSGPDGLDLVPANAGTAFKTLYAGDANAMFVLNAATGALVKKIVINGLGPCAAPCAGGPPLLAGAAVSLHRADEGCFDADDNIEAISSPGENPPFMTFIDTLNQNVIATVYFPSIGLEACVYDTTTKRFYVNNDGSGTNPRGEVDGVPASSIAAVRAAGTATWPGGNQYVFPGTIPPGINPAPAAAVALPLVAPGTTVVQPLNACDPTGIILGAGTDLAVMCRQGNVGEFLTFQIYNKTTLGPANPPVANLNAGGGDQITYDAATNRYYLGTSRWTASGLSCGAGTAACPLTPVLTIVDAATRTVVARLPAGNNSHSIGVVGGFAYSPFTTSTVAGGGAGFDPSNNGGIAIYRTQ
ncbi:MAG: hypothetical protein JWO70_1250 [Betaproteobacteria bacterium]|nr:hypothetical protein [Betaproteobacteria bacterium]